MKIVVDNQTNLKVEDQDGNMLFQHLPKKQDFVVKHIRANNDVNIKELADGIEKELRKASTTYM